ncbi:MAG: GNAT family N-acetyltransferase [Chloroflexota bacterium]|nr:GNAT family N-acetyltransferase [Chloroflexota bacterium]
MSEWTQGDYTISTDRTRLDLAVIHEYLSNQSYWAGGRPLAVIRQSIEHSLCFGVYDGEAQVGFARTITDYTTYAYLADVFILPTYQGNGLGKWLMQTILAAPTLADVYRWALHTRGAHGLYAQFGFTGLAKPESAMERRTTPPFLPTS